MAGITQSIPNYILGISTQPDELKTPGQVVDLKNGLPDITLGLTKRPGGKLISTLSPNSGTLSWFHIYEDETNQYIGNVNTSGVIQVWRTHDGASIPIDYGQVPGNNACTYLTGWTDAQEIQPLTLNFNTFLTNRTKTVVMKTSAADKSPAAVHEAIVEIKTVSYGKQYALDLYDPANTAITTTNRATSIAVHESLGSLGTNDGNCSKMALENLRTANNLAFEIDLRCQPIAEGGGSTSNHPNYDNSYQAFASLQFGGEGYTTGDTVGFTMTKGATGTIEIKSHVQIRSRATLTGAQGPSGTCMVRPKPTSANSDEAVDAAGILGDMKTALDAVKPSGMTTTITGNCLHIKHTAEFNITTPENELLNVVTSKVNTVGELPNSCRHNFVVKVVNSAEEEDDYYLKFQVNNVASSVTADRFGSGVWEECPKPGITIEIDDDTLPVRLERGDPGNWAINGGSSTNYANGIFRLTKPDWAKRSVGDEITNPDPSFIDKKISKLLFFRNRLTFLSENNVICSQTNDFYNVFSKTAQSVSNSDPVDVQASSVYPTKLFDAIEINSGLLIHSSNQQFMLTTDSDTFSPQTAKLNYLSSYNYNEKIPPFSLGTTTGFMNSSGKNARFFEISEARREGEPVVVEQSKIVSRKLPIDLSNVTVSKENGVLFFGTAGSSEVWGYRYYSSGEKRLQAAWFRWELPGTLVKHVILDDVYYVILKNGANYTLEAYDVKKQDDTTVVNDYLIHLDTHSTVSSLAAGTYNATTKKTVFPKPAGYNSSKQLAIYDNNTGTNIGRYGLVTVNGSNLEVDGNWTGANLILGYLFDWLIEIPTIYATQQVGNKTRSDTRASLVVHRLKFSFGAVGLIDTTLKRTGRADYTNTYESLEWDAQTSNNPAIASEYVHTIPVYEKNTNLTVQVKSSHPTPATLHSLNWEGDFNNKFYRRA
jgi:hypothetical protein